MLISRASKASEALSEAKGQRNIQRSDERSLAVARDDNELLEVAMKKNLLVLVPFLLTACLGGAPDEIIVEGVPPTTTPAGEAAATAAPGGEGEGDPIATAVAATVAALQSTQAPTQPTAAPTSTAAPIITPAPAVITPGWDTVWYKSPVVATGLTDTATQEIFAEPGVQLDAAAAWDYMSASETPVLVPEGGYAYIAVGAADIAGLPLTHEEGNIYLVVLRGIPDDGTDADLNQIVTVTGYARGAGIYSQLPAGAYISVDWFVQQIGNAKNAPNCGATGCKKATIVAIDLQTKTYRDWIVTDLGNPKEWERK